MNWIKKNLPGILVCLAIATPAWLLGKTLPVIGGAVFSLHLVWHGHHPLLGREERRGQRDQVDVQVYPANGRRSPGLWDGPAGGRQDRPPVPADYHLHHLDLALARLAFAQVFKHPRQDLNLDLGQLIHLRGQRHRRYRPGYRR